MTPTLTNIYDWFDEFNKAVFNNRLPRVNITFTNTRRQLGQFYWWGDGTKGIKISQFYDRNEQGFRTTLLHEMCHLYCYQAGYIYEHHGARWKAIAEKASRITGLKIQRVEKDEVFVPRGERNKATSDAVMAKRNAPAILVDIEYSTHHFIVKTTKKVIWDNCDGEKITGYGRVVKGVYICDTPEALSWENSRSLNRGYKYPNEEYERSIAPMLAKAIKVDDLRKLCFWGEYDFLGVR